MDYRQNTKSISGIQYSDADIFRFERGLPGFEHLHNFIISSQPEHAPFHWMHSLDQPGLRFVLVNPMSICPDYDPRLTKVHLNDIGIRSQEDILLYVIVTIDNKNPNSSTANLLGPVLINIREHRGNQVILDDARYSVRYPIFGGQN